jgi:hypothetical protein
MTQYKLIKLEEGNIVVSDEEIKKNDLFLRGTYFLKASNNFGIMKNSYDKKVIASDFHSELPNIDYNGLEEEFGIVDVEKLWDLESYAHKHNGNSFSFKRGFKKAQSLNDKMFSLEDMFKCFQAGMDYEKEGGILHPDSHGYIQSLQQPTTFDIEGVLENNVFKITKVC